MIDAIRIAIQTTYTPELRVDSDRVAATPRDIQNPNARTSFESAPVVMPSNDLSVHQKARAFLRVAGMTTPAGLMASEWVGPKILTTDHRQLTVPQLLANALLNRVSVLDAGTHPVADWSELRQRAFNKDTIIEGGLLLAGVLATKGKHPNAVRAAVQSKKSAKRPSGPSLETQIRSTEKYLNDQKGLLEQTRKELSVFERYPKEYANEIQQRQTWITKLEKIDIPKLEKQLKALQNKHSRATNKVR